MAKIPIISQDVRMRPSSPVEIGSTGFSRMQGEATSDFGKGMTNMGLALMDFDKRKNNELENVQIEEFYDKVREKSLGRFDEMQRDPEFRSRDTRETVGIFNTNLSKDMDQVAGEMGLSGLTKRKAYNKANDIRLGGMESVRTAAMKANVEYIDQKYADIKNQKTALATMDPANYQLYQAEYIEAIAKSPMGTEIQKTMELERAGKEFFLTATNAYMKQGKFDKATKLVEDRGIMLGVEERDKLFDTISNERDRWQDREWQDISRKEITEKREREKLVAINDNDMVKRMFEMDQTQINYDNIVTEADQKRAAGLISETAYAIVKNKNTVVDEKLSDTTAWPYYGVILGKTKSLESIQKDLEEDVSSGKLKSDRASALLQLAYQQEHTGKKKSDSWKADERAARVKMSAPFTDPITKAIMSPEAGSQYSQVLHEYSKYLSMPEYEDKPYEAAILALRKVRGVKDARSQVTGLTPMQQSNPDSAKQAMQEKLDERDVKKKKGVWTPADESLLMKTMKEYTLLLKQFEIDEEAKKIQESRDAKEKEEADKNKNWLQKLTGGF